MKTKKIVELSPDEIKIILGGILREPRFIGQGNQAFIRWGNSLY